MSFFILGLGIAVPPTAVDQDTATAVADRLCCHADEHRSWLPAMYQQTGIKQRYMQYPRAVLEDVVNGTRTSGSPYLPAGTPDDRGPTTARRMSDYHREAVVLSLESSRAGLAEAALPPRRITHLVTVSCTGFSAPGFDLELIARLPLAPTVARTHVGFMGCHGALNGLRVARAFTAADPAARVLVCATELCSLHYHYGWDPQKMVANALFADGSAAVVGSADAPVSAPRLVANGSCVIPESADAMTWTVGDHGFEMTLSKQVPHLIRRHLRPWLADWLGSHGVTPAVVGGWAIHPGGPRVLEAVEEALGLPAEATAVSREVFAGHGNMSSPTVLFILRRLMELRTPGPWVALGFGPGMVAEAALLQTTDR